MSFLRFTIEIVPPRGDVDNNERPEWIQSMEDCLEEHFDAVDSAVVTKLEIINGMPRSEQRTKHGV